MPKLLTAGNPEKPLNIKLTVVVSEVTNCRLVVATARDGWVMSPSILHGIQYPVARNDGQGSSCLLKILEGSRHKVVDLPWRVALEFT